MNPMLGNDRFAAAHDGSILTHLPPTHKPPDVWVVVRASSERRIHPPRLVVPELENQAAESALPKGNFTDDWVASCFGRRAQPTDYFPERFVTSSPTYQADADAAMPFIPPEPNGGQIMAAAGSKDTRRDPNSRVVDHPIITMALLGGRILDHNLPVVGVSGPAIKLLPPRIADVVLILQNVLGPGSRIP